MMTRIGDLKKGDIFFCKRDNRWYQHRGDFDRHPDTCIHALQLRRNGQSSGNCYILHKSDPVRADFGYRG